MKKFAHPKKKKKLLTIIGDSEPSVALFVFMASYRFEPMILWHEPRKPCVISSSLVILTSDHYRPEVLGAAP